MLLYEPESGFYKLPRLRRSNGEMGSKVCLVFSLHAGGNDAVPELLPSPEQREFMYHRIREIRRTKPIFAMDFQTTENMWAAALRAEEDICILMQMGM